MSTRQSQGRHRAVPAEPARSAHAAPRKLPRRAAVVATGTLVLTTSGIAFAAWTAYGSGPSDTRAITAADIVVTAASAGAELYPGGTGSVTFTVQNPNPYAVSLTTADFGTISSRLPEGSTCAAGSVVPVAASIDLAARGQAISLPAQSGTVTVTLPGVVSMVTTATDACQGNTFTVPVALSGVSTAS